jgi:aryl-alcohol dehydrogenase-like predicted oxidoreductase
MRTRPLGRTGWPVSEIGYGMWGMGGWSGSDDGESRASLHRAVERGCTFFDTAFAYGLGHSERLLGEVVRTHADRGLVVATKVPPKNLKWPGRAEYSVADTFPPDHVREFTEKSLANLGLPRIDLLQFHVWDDAWAADDGWRRAIEDLKRAGTIRAFGISVNRWQPENVLDAIDTGLVDTVQVVYNVFDQAPEDRLFPACRAHGVGVIARVPFDEGSLTGTLTRDTRFPETDWRSSYFTPANLEATLSRVERLRALVPDGSTLPDLALRFILASPDVSTVIPGMRRARHVDANLAASDRGPLPAPLVAALRAHRWDRVPNLTA